MGRMNFAGFNAAQAAPTEMSYPPDGASAWAMNLWTAAARTDGRDDAAPAHNFTAPGRTPGRKKRFKKTPDPEKGLTRCP
jgi:hypothetical protein